MNDSAVDNSAVKASLEEGCELIFFECDSCSQCDFCGKGMEAPKDLKKDKKIKCDLELSYDGLARPVSEKLLASVTIKFSKNSKFHKHSTRHEAVKNTGLQTCLARQNWRRKSLDRPWLVLVEKFKQTICLKMSYNAR